MNLKTSLFCAFQQTPKLNKKTPAWVNTLPSTATTTLNAVSNLQSNFTVFKKKCVYKEGLFTSRISKNDKMNHLPILVLSHTWLLQVEGILKEKLSENYDKLIESITNTTQKNQSDIIPPEDLRRLIQQYGLPLSERHFSKWVSLFCPQSYLWVLTNFPNLCQGSLNHF